MFWCVPTQPVIENSKIIPKIFKKLENTILASFQAKIGCERLRKREKKKIIPMCSYPTRNKNSQKKFKKLENTIIASFQAKIGCERLRKREKKNRLDVFLPDP